MSALSLKNFYLRVVHLELVQLQPNFNVSTLPQHNSLFICCSVDWQPNKIYNLCWAIDLRGSIDLVRDLLSQVQRIHWNHQRVQDPTLMSVNSAHPAQRALAWSQDEHESEADD